MPTYPNRRNSINVKKRKTESKLGIILICVFSILLLELVFNLIPFFNQFLYGVIGLTIYPICLFFIALGIMKLRRVKIKLVNTEIVYLIASFVCLLALVHLFTSSAAINNSYQVYLADTYHLTNGYTAGGVIFSFLVYPMYSMTHLAGASVFFAIIMLVLITLFVDSLYRRKSTRVFVEESKNTNEQEGKTDEQSLVQSNTRDLAYDEDLFIADESNEPKDDQANRDKAAALKILGLEKNNDDEILEDDDDIFEADDVPTTAKRPQMVVHDDEVVDAPEMDIDYSNSQSISVARPKSDVIDAKAKQKAELEKRNREYLDDIMGKSSDIKQSDTTLQSSNSTLTAKEKLFGSASNFNNGTQNNSFNNNWQTKTSIDSSSWQKNESKVTWGESEEKSNSSWQKSDRTTNFNKSNNIQSSGTRPNSIDFKSSDNTDIYDANLTRKSYERNKAEYIDRLNKFDTASAGIAKAKEVYTMEENTTRNDAKAYTSNVVNVNEINHIKPKKEIKRRPYVRPTIDLLDQYDNSNIEVEDNEEKTRRLEAVLDSFRIPAKVCSVARGPSFTRFELTMPVGISVKKIDNLVPDMQMALACKGAIRTEIPIPGKSAFGIEIPNEVKETVGLRDIIDSYEFQNSKYITSFGLGKDISNSPIIGNIEKMPHLLVAGTTGSGKSVCLNSMLVSLLYKASPEDVRLILIDPKRLEFSLYNGLPHLLVPEVITNKEKAMNAFDWLIDEMNRRISFFESLKMGIRNIEEYNSCSKVKSGELQKMPLIVVIVDELNELMMQTRKEMESKIVRIAQLSRAVGIHLVLATQRPSVDVITGLVKSNLPSRIAFAVASANDSITILNQGGAESLLGYGDMLYSPIGTKKPVRLQGAFLKNSEVERVVNFVKDNNDCIFDEELEEQMFNREQELMEGGTGGTASDGNNLDPLMKDVLRFAIKSGGISTTKVQRYLRIGYPRAAKIIDDMEALNYISKKDDKNNRVIFMTQQEFEEVFGEDF